MSETKRCGRPAEWTGRIAGFKMPDGREYRFCKEHAHNPNHVKVWIDPKVPSMGMKVIWSEHAELRQFVAEKIFEPDPSPCELPPLEEHRSDLCAACTPETVEVA